ncbi:hypothetical protein [Mucilaginibacter sp.]|uniref:hypothetical protein n=1 Tax=Mucilaginibacter sp. TaxID=1882438 RepID=UPI0025F3DD13|nr:hypothetical protein [Mucilaginibacter sp.]
MKKIREIYITLFFVAISTFATGILHAQANPGDLKNATPEQRAQMQTGMMKSKLKLDTNQVLKVQAINLKYAHKFEPIIKGSDGRMKKMKEAMSLQKQKDAELKQVFTTEQYKQYQDFEQEMKSKMMSRLNGK